MSESHEDNLSSDYKEKTKRKAKRGSLRGLIGVRMLALLAGLGVLMYFALRPVPKTVMEFDLIPHPTLSPSIPRGIADMEAVENGYIVVAYTENGLERIDFEVDLEAGTAKRTNEVNSVAPSTPGLLGFPIPPSISPSQDIVYTDRLGTTYFLSSDGILQTIALNSPVTTTFSTDGKRFALSNTAGIVVVYDAVSRSIVLEINANQTPVYYGYTVNLNHDATQLLISGISSTTIYDLSGTALSSMEGGLANSALNVVSLSSGKWITGLYATFKIINGTTIVDIPIEDRDCQYPAQMELSSNEKWLVLRANSGYVCIIDVSTLLELQGGESIEARKIGFGETLSSIAISKDEKTFGVYTQSQSKYLLLYVIDLETATIVASMKAN